MIHSLSDQHTLNNGVTMPGFGLGVWRVPEGDSVRHSVAWAIEAGYRLIDTAAIYGNERGVGEAIRDSGIARGDLFLTTKVWNADQGYDKTLEAFETSLNKLGVDYVDLYLIHWPVAGKYKDTWRALERLQREGRTRAIGVCNFHPHHLEDLLADAEAVPAVDQVELHPLLTQVPLRHFCAKNGIAVEAYSPLGSGDSGLLTHPQLIAIAEKYGKSTAQIILRWNLEHDIITIPRSTKQAHIADNAAVFDFELSAEDIGMIDALNADRRFGADPDNFDF
ncbi:MAG: aldo/keto reductase [Sporolactobacillus sp.]